MTPTSTIPMLVTAVVALAGAVGVLWRALYRQSQRHQAQLDSLTDRFVTKAEEWSEKHAAVLTELNTMVAKFLERTERAEQLAAQRMPTESGR